MNIKEIEEDDISEYIESRIDKNSWSEIFFEMKKEIDAVASTKKNTDIYSMSYNYTPIFMYYAIEGNCSLDEFSKILQISNNYEDGLSRFFETPDCSYDEKENSHVYDKMGYIFLEKNNEGKLNFNKKKEGYIYEMIKNARTQNLLDFHSSRIDFFLSFIIKKDKEIGKYIIDLISETPSMLIEEHMKYHNIPMSIMREFANESYDKNVSDTYHLFKGNVVFKNLMFKNLISLDYQSKYKTDLAFYEMVSQNEDNYFEIFLDRVREFQNILSKDEYIDLVRDTLFSIKEGLKKHPFKLNIEKIDINRKIIDNIPYLVVLDDLIKIDYNEFIVGENKNLANYLTLYENEIKDKKFDSDIISVEEYFMLKGINFNRINSMLQYKNLNLKIKQELDKNLTKEKSVKTKISKI